MAPRRPRSRDESLPANTGQANASAATAAQRWVFSHLRLPRPLDPATVDRLLLRLAADQAGPTLVFEARAEHGQLVDHVLGVPATHVRPLLRTLRDLISGLETDGIAAEDEQPRVPVETAARVRVRPRALALATDRPEAISTALLSALNTRLDEGDRLVVQVVLGPRHAPTHLPRLVADPTRTGWQALLGELFEEPRAAGAATKPVRDQIDARVGQHGFSAIIRVGVSAATPERRRQLVTGVLGALSTAAGRETYLELEVEPASRLNDAGTPQGWRGWWQGWDMALGSNEVIGLLVWPYGEGDLPGVAPLHPRQLRVPATVSRTERVFAVPGAPGPAMPVGIAADAIAAHFLVTGPTGVGKSVVLEQLAAHDAAAGRALVVVDPKRQLVDDIIDRAVPAHRVDDVVIIDPADATSTAGAVAGGAGRVVGFNPLNVGDRDPDVVADGLVAVLAGVFAEGWGPRTEDIMHSSIATLARVGARRTRTGAGVSFTLLDVPRLLTDERFRASVVGHVAGDAGLASFWAWYQALTPAGQANAIAAPLNKLRRILNRPSLRAILGQPEPAFRLRDVFRDNKIVLVPLNEALIGPITAQLLGSLVVAEIWNATLERAREVEPGKRPASVMIDEVQQFLHLPVSVEDALARSRSFGVGWHLAHQHRAQLPPSTRAAIDSNARSKVIFRPLDPDDARDIAKQAPELTAADFLALGRYQAYVNLSTGGDQSGWALVKTLPPPAPTGLGHTIRAASRDNFATACPTPAPAPQAPAAGSSPQHSSATGPDCAGTAAVSDRLGRKPRQP